MITRARGLKRLPLMMALLPLFLAMPSQAATVLLRDDFTGTQLRTDIWSVGNWTLGRSPLGNRPVVANGIARLPFDTYGFRGTEIFTNRAFSRGTGIEFETRCKLNALPSGLITAFFTYVFDGTTKTADEIDIEILTKQVNQSSGGAPVNFTTFNDWNAVTGSFLDGIHNWTIIAKVAGLNVNLWHTYVIRWLPDRTEWLIDGKLVATSRKALPNADQPLHVNIWAPTSSWPDAYDSRLQPVTTAAKNQRFYFDVDYVEVRSLP